MVRRLILTVTVALCLAAFALVVAFTPPPVLPLALMGWVAVVAVMVATGPRPDVSMPDPEPASRYAADPHAVGL